MSSFKYFLKILTNFAENFYLGQTDCGRLCPKYSIKLPGRGYREADRIIQGRGDFLHTEAIAGMAGSPAKEISIGMVGRESELP